MTDSLSIWSKLLAVVMGLAAGLLAVGLFIALLTLSTRGVVGVECGKGGPC